MLSLLLASVGVSLNFSCTAPLTVSAYFLRLAGMGLITRQPYCLQSAPGLSGIKVSNFSEQFQGESLSSRAEQKNKEVLE